MHSFKTYFCHFIYQWPVVKILPCKPRQEIKDHLFYQICFFLLASPTLKSSKDLSRMNWTKWVLEYFIIIIIIIIIIIVFYWI